MTDFMNEYCMHTATCGELRKGDVGREVVLCGWAWHNRDHGGLIFVDLRDRAGYTQVVVDPDCVSADDFAKAEHLGREYVLKIAGTVRERGAEAVNPNMATGEIEVLAKSVEVLNTSVTPPFSIEDGIETDETTRMKWRYLDIRRPEMYQALHLRHKVAQAMRGALNERGFLEVETPILANSTPDCINNGNLVSTGGARCGGLLSLANHATNSFSGCANYGEILTDDANRGVFFGYSAYATSWINCIAGGKVGVYNGGTAVYDSYGENEQVRWRLWTPRL